MVGNSGANRRHVDRTGCPVFVVTDYYTIDRVPMVKCRNGCGRPVPHELDHYDDSLGCWQCKSVMIRRCGYVVDNYTNETCGDPLPCGRHK